MRVRVAEVLGALSTACDLADGFALEKCLRTTVVGVRLARAVGAGTEEQRAVFWACLLRFLGCTAFAHEEGPLSAGDDVALRRTLARVDFGSVGEFVGAAVRGIGRHAPVPARVRALGRLLTDPSAPRRHATAQCEVGIAFARELGIDGVEVVLALRDERWDGRGPRGSARGEELPFAARVADVADVFELTAWHEGLEAAAAELRRRSGGALDPRLVEAAAADPAAWWEGLYAPSAWDVFLDSEPAPHRLAATDDELDGLLRAWALFPDVASVYTLGHSTQVAALASAAASAAGLGDDGARGARRAGWVHDLGRVAVPIGLWEKPGPLLPIERERVRSHALHGDTVLRLVPVDGLAELAGATHERVGGKGYPRRLPLDREPLVARLVAAADVYVALRSERPHRPALAPDAAVRTLRDAAELDRAAVEAVLAAAGHRPARKAPALTEREREVARLVAIGRTNRDVGELLGMSPRTAQKHVAHIYEKLGLESRAGLALWAVEHGLLDP